MERIHSIKNPDSFSDCISMLFSFAMQEDVEWNFDIMSGRCFRMQYETDIKKWIHTAVSVQESMGNIAKSTGCQVKVRKIEGITCKDLSYMAEKGAVLGPLERKRLSQAVEDVYFIGGKHFVYLTDIEGKYAIIHDPDSSQCIIVEVDDLMEILKQEACYSITMESMLPVKLSAPSHIMKEGIQCYLESDRPKIILGPCRGVAEMAAFRYGLRLFLFYNYEVLSMVKKNTNAHALREEIEEYLKNATKGYFNCKWEQFEEIESNFRRLLEKCGRIYGI